MQHMALSAAVLMQISSVKTQIPPQVRFTHCGGIFSISAGQFTNLSNILS
jgi:hypothetical protein